MRRATRLFHVISLFIALLLVSSSLTISSPVASGATYRSPAADLADRLAASPAGEHLSWAVEQVNDGGASLTAEDIVARFSDDFLNALPVNDLIGVFTAYLAPYGPMRIARLEGGVTATRANALLIAADGEPWRVRLGIEVTEPYRINDLFFEPAYRPVGMDNPPTSWSSLNKHLDKVAPEVGFLAAEVTDGACEPVSGLNADQELAVGSTFKLYILGELARQIEAGDITWDDLLKLTPRLKSLPTGNLLYEPNGSLFSLVEFAERMTAESDNTATDHLISFLGRKNVEAMMATMGHAHPASNIPLLMTREWFAIKLRLSDDLIDEYIAADDERQREILTHDVKPKADTLWDGEEWINPYLIDSIEWFASAADLCRAAAYLQEQSSRRGLAPVLDCLSLEPGIAFDPAIWTYVGYKGGYETGVKSHVWLLQREDGRWFAITAIINDPTKEIDGVKLNGLMIPAAALLAKTS